MRQKWGKEVSRSEEARNDMEEAQEVKKVRRLFTPEQKFEILKDIERCKTIKEGLAKHQLAQSLYHKWKRQLEVGVRASLRNSRPLKSANMKRLEAENRKLKEYCWANAIGAGRRGCLCISHKRRKQKDLIPAMTNRIGAATVTLQNDR